MLFKATDPVISAVLYRQRSGLNWLRFNSVSMWCFLMHWQLSRCVLTCNLGSDQNLSPQLSLSWMYAMMQKLKFKNMLRNVLEGYWRTTRSVCIPISDMNRKTITLHQIATLHLFERAKIMNIENKRDDNLQIPQQKSSSAMFIVRNEQFPSNRLNGTASVWKHYVLQN